MHRRIGITLGVIVIVAAVVRAAGLFDDFWLDEIWSYSIARQIHAPLDVLLLPAARIDNNHPLNTLLMWLIGDHACWWIYRVPSLLAGVGSVILAGMIAARRGSTSALLAAALTGFSYPLVLYSSEARGYSLAFFFALLAFDASQRYLASSTWVNTAIFALACAVGILSHLTFIHVYAGIAAWTLYRLLRTQPWQSAIARIAQLHAIPLCIFVAVYLVFVRSLTLGGSPPQPMGRALPEAISALLVAAGSFQWNIIAAAAAAVLFVWCCIRLAREGYDLWIFLLVAMVVSPVLALVRQALILPPERYQPIAARYFLLDLPFLFLAVAMLLPAVFRRRPARYFAGAALGAFVAINAWQIARFLHIGRGHYSAAVIYMADHTPPQQPITVLSDQPYRTGLVLEFYRRVLPPGRPMDIYDGTQSPPPAFAHGPPRWFIRQYNLTGSPPAPRYNVLDNLYVMDREFTYYGLSGYSWYLYRRQNEPLAADGKQR